MRNLDLHCSVVKKISSKGKDFYVLYVEELKREFFLTQQDVYILGLLFGNSSNNEHVTD